MAAKFQIFIDPADGDDGCTTKEAKREPLGLRQPQPLQQQQLQPPHQQHQHYQQQVTHNSSSSSATTIDDQENDISMASLGSDFVPSILHDGDHSFECDESADGLETSILSHQTAELRSSEGQLDFDESDLLLDEDDDDQRRVVGDGAGTTEDEELQMELSQAFRQHDDSQLFKSSAYIDDINLYLRELERKPELRPLPNYMDFQNHIDPDKRAILINWLVEVSDEYELQTETLFICAAIIDRFLSKMSVSTGNFQLLGVAAMFIASKYEEIYPPNLYQFVDITDQTYSGRQICQMEQEILKTINFRISIPTISYFLREIFAYNKLPKKVYHLAEYLCYLSLVADQPFLEYYPSDIALASVILAAHQLGAKASISNELKKAFDKSNLDQLERRNLPKNVELCKVDRRVYVINKELPFCIEALRAIQEKSHSRASRLPTDSAIYYRYSLASHDSVALLPAPSVEDLMMIAK